jgi:hypothetical protein
MRSPERRLRWSNGRADVAAVVLIDPGDAFARPGGGGEARAQLSGLFQENAGQFLDI